jgi:hypothetical protein
VDCIAGREVLEKRKNLLPPLGFESPDHPVRNLVAMAINCIPSTGDGLDFNLGVTWFESRLSRRLSLVVVICRLSRTIPEYYPDK